MSSSLAQIVPAGVVTGDNLIKLLEHAKANGYAIPAVNCTTSSTINAVLEAAREANSAVMIQFSNGGGAFMAGKGLSNKGQQASIAGSVAGALLVRSLAKFYGVPVVLHTDHCARNLLPWLDGLLEANREYFAQHGEPLFSSHMIDLSEDPLEENIATCVKYMKEFSKLNILLEVELGITGGEEDGVDNSDVDKDALYTQPEEVYEMYKALSAVGPMFSIAAAFGNVHGVYKPGNVVLKPGKLAEHQAFIREKIGAKAQNVVFFVFHGGSGSSREEIREAISAGTIKMNIDTDCQWAYWDGIRQYEAKNHDYLQGQIGNPEGEDKPNKKKYDPRVWLRKAEEAMIARLKASFDDLNATGSLGATPKL